MLDIEAQIFNVYNHQNLGLPDNQGAINSPVSGFLPREIQLRGQIHFLIGLAFESLKGDVT